MWSNRKPIRRRTVVLLAFGTLIIVGVPFYIQFYLRRPTGSGPAGPAVDRQPFSEAWTDRPVMLLGIGDSVTRGLGAKSKSHSYFNRLAKNPADEFDAMRGVSLIEALPKLTTLNLAVSGSTSLYHQDVVADELVSYPEEVFGIVVMTTGGNDLIHSYGRRPPIEGAMYGASIAQAKPWVKSFATRLDRMLSTITERFPGGCEIYLADIYDPTDGVGDAVSIFLPRWADGLAIHSLYNQAIRNTASKHSNVHVVPMHAAFLGHGSHCRQFWRSTYDSHDPTYWFWDNIEDPNDRGYDAIRRVFLNTIVENSALRRNQPH